MKRFVLTLAAATAFAAPISAHSASYAVEAGVKGVVNLYDLSSVTPTPGGFSIDEVVAADHWVNVFGPTAYRVTRERYDCAGGTYDIVAMREYRRDGVLVDALHTPPTGAMRVMPATASSEMANRFCPRTGAVQGATLPGLAPVAYVDEASAFDAYRYGRTMLAR